MASISIGLSDSVRGAFETEKVIGVKVIDRPDFMRRLHKELEKWLEKGEPWGSFKLELPNTEPRVVSFGIGRRRSDMTATDFHVRMVDGWPTVFLNRGYALTANTVTCKMMTRAAWFSFLKDYPYGRGQEELEHIKGNQDITHFLVEIFDAGPRKQFSPDKFITALIHDSKAQSDLNMFFDSLYLVHKMAEDINNFYRDFWPVADCE